MNTNSQLKALYKEFSETFSCQAESSRMEYMKNLPAGAPAPEKGKIYGDSCRKNFKEYARRCEAAACELINAALSDARRSASAPPSSEAVNAVQMLALNPRAEARDFALMMERYGDNYQTAQTLAGLAAARDFHITNNNPAVKRLEAMENLNSGFLNSFSLASAEQGRGALWDYMVESAIDEAFAP